MCCIEISVYFLVGGKKDLPHYKKVVCVECSDVCMWPEYRYQFSALGWALISALFHVKSGSFQVSSAFGFLLWCLISWKYAFHVSTYRMLVISVTKTCTEENWEKLQFYQPGSFKYMLDYMGSLHH